MEQVCLIQKTLEGKSDDKTKTVSKGKPQETKQTKPRRRFQPPTCFHCEHVRHVQRWCPFLMPSKTEPVQFKDGKPVIRKSPDKKQENSQG